MNAKLLTSILQHSNELIKSESFLLHHRIGNAFTRSGKLSFPNLIYFVLQSFHKSISVNYARFLHNFSSELPPFVSKQAISKARQGISHEAFLELFRLYMKIKRRDYFLFLLVFRCANATVGRALGC